jgi:hypothetical protein
MSTSMIPLFLGYNCVNMRIICAMIGVFNEL